PAERKRETREDVASADDAESAADLRKRCEGRTHVARILSDDAEVVAVVADARRDGAVEIAEADDVAVRRLRPVTVTFEDREPPDAGCIALEDRAIGEDASLANADDVHHARRALEITELGDRRADGVRRMRARGRRALDLAGERPGDEDVAARARLHVVD